MSRTDVTITTRDGACPASVFEPGGKARRWREMLSLSDGALKIAA